MKRLQNTLNNREIFNENISFKLVNISYNLLTQSNYSKILKELGICMKQLKFISLSIFPSFNFTVLIFVLFEGSFMNLTWLNIFIYLRGDTVFLPSSSHPLIIWFSLL